MRLIIFTITLLLLINKISLGQGVSLGSQRWMPKNLEVSKFKNGDEIFEAKNLEDWVEANRKGMAAYCYYNFDPNNGPIYGKLYNWYAVTDYRGLAPLGWKVPSKEDFETLTLFLGREAGTEMKSYAWLKKIYTTTEYLKLENPGFNALGGGYLSPYGYFQNLDKFGTWWTSTQSDSFNACVLSLMDMQGGYVDVGSDMMGFNGGASVRCVLDN